MQENKFKVDDAVVEDEHIADRPNSINPSTSVLSALQASKGLGAPGRPSSPQTLLDNTSIPPPAAVAPDVDKPSIITALWPQLDALLLKTRQCQTAMSELRGLMKTLRRQRQDVENNFTEAISRSTNGNESLGALLANLIKRSQAVQDDYNSAEARYEALEIALEDLEAEKHSIEARLVEQLQLVGCPRKDAVLSTLTDGSTAAEKGGDAPATEESKKEQNGLGHNQAGQGLYPRNVQYPSSNKSRPPDDPSLLGISGDRHSDIHPLYGELIHAIGGRQMADESLSELILEHGFILDELQTKLLLKHSHQGSLYLSEKELDALKADLNKVSSDNVRASLARASSASLAHKYSSLLGAQDADFLRQFDSNVEASLDELEYQSWRVNELREACNATGVMRKDMPYSEEYAIYGPGDGTGNDDLVQSVMADAPPQGTMNPDGLSNPYFPVLLTSPKHLLEMEPLTAKVALKKALELPADYPMRELLVQEKIKEYGISTTLTRFKEGYKMDFINRWLLQRLRISPLEVELLYSLFTMRLEVLNSTQWQNDVLHFWTKDGLQSATGPATVCASTFSEEPDGTFAMDSERRLVLPPEKQPMAPIFSPKNTQVVYPLNRPSGYIYGFLNVAAYM